MRKKPLAAFPYYGGKTIHLKWLLPLLPKTQCYVEPFGGSAAVLLNRAPSPVEVYNDLDSEVVNFFRCLREDTPRLHRLLRLTPHSREEFKLALEYKGSDPYERARCFLIRIRQVRSGMQNAKVYNWAFSVSSGNAMARAVGQWRASINSIDEVADRLSQVQIENRQANKLLTQYDSKDTLFYCDPPYAPNSRKSMGTYTCEMTTKQHKQFLKIANSLVGKVAISGYDSKLYNRYLAHWYKHRVLVVSSVNSAANGTQGARTEVLWTNYKPLRSLF